MNDRLTRMPVPYSLVSAPSQPDERIVESGKSIGRTFVLLGVLGLAPAIAMGAWSLPALVSTYWPRVSISGGDWWSVGPVLGTALAGLGWLTYGLLLRSSARALVPVAKDEIAICHKSMWNGKWKIAARDSAERCRVVRHAVSIQTAKAVGAWHGYACVAYVGKEKFVLAVVSDRTELITIVDNRPGWLKCDVQDGPDISVWGDVVVGKKVRCEQ